MTPADKTKSATASPAAGNGRRTAAILVGAIAGVIIAVGAFAMWVKGRNDAPPVNSDSATLAGFVTSDSYASLSFDRQATYMKVLEDREDAGELKDALEAGKLKPEQYRAAITEAWLGEQLKRSEKYASLPPSAKPKYIGELLGKKEKKKSPGNKPRSSGGNNGDIPEIKRDASTSQARINAWPADARRKWEEFKTAYDAAKDARDAVASEGPSDGAANR